MTKIYKELRVLGNNKSDMFENEHNSKILKHISESLAYRITNDVTIHVMFKHGDYMVRVANIRNERGYSQTPDHVIEQVVNDVISKTDVPRNDAEFIAFLMEKGYNHNSHIWMAFIIDPKAGNRLRKKMDAERILRFDFDDIASL